jgi:hypothetical protein
MGEVFGDGMLRIYVLFWKALEQVQGWNVPGLHDVCGELAPSTDKGGLGTQLSDDDEVLLYIVLVL